MITKNTFILMTLSVLALVSCQKRQYGYFNNHYPQYSKNSNKTENILPKSETIAEALEASSDSKEIQLNTTTATTNTSNKVAENKTSTTNTPLSKKEKREIKREVKKQIRQSANEERTGAMTVLLVILAIILPPLAVLLVDGLKGPFWLSILLTLIFYVPGLIYALWRVFKQ